MFSDIMSISRLRLGTDGEGVSTLVTFFGCPLKCTYCANDFCHNNEMERAFYTPEDLIKALSKDEIYYLMSNGGVVFGGGEPLLQSEFIHKVCKKMNSDWNRRIETSLNVDWKNIEQVLDDFDEWIIDVKSMNPSIYLDYTGAAFDRFYHNLQRLAKHVDASKLHLRVPRIPNYTSEQDVEESVKKIREEFGVEPEVFDYLVFKKHADEDDLGGMIYDG